MSNTRPLIVRLPLLWKMILSNNEHPDESYTVDLPCRRDLSLESGYLEISHIG